MEEVNEIKQKKVSTISEAASNRSVVTGLAQKLAPEEEYNAQRSRAKANIARAQELKKEAAELEEVRKQTEESLKQAKALESEWMAVESEMYRAIQPFSMPALQSRLESATKESESVGETMAASFLDGNSEDLTQFIRQYRVERAQFHRRREWLERWKEERVSMA